MDDKYRFDDMLTLKEIKSEIRQIKNNLVKIHFYISLAVGFILLFSSYGLYRFELYRLKQITIKELKATEEYLSMELKKMEKYNKKLYESQMEKSKIKPAQEINKNDMREEIYQDKDGTYRQRYVMP